MKRAEIPISMSVAADAILVLRISIRFPELLSAVGLTASAFARPPTFALPAALLRGQSSKPEFANPRALPRWRLRAHVKERKNGKRRTD